MLKGQFKPKNTKKKDLVYVFLCVLFFFTTTGPTPNSPTLATLSGDLPTPFNITTSGHQFLVRWSSDHGTNKKGFRIRYVGEYQSMYPNFTFYYFTIQCMKIKASENKRDRQKTLKVHCYYCVDKTTKYTNIYV